MNPYEATMAECRKLLAFIENKLTDIEWGRLRGCTEDVKAELKQNAAIFKNKIADLERKRDAGMEG